MSEAVITEIQNEIVELKNNMAVIMHVLSEEGKLSNFAKALLIEANKTDDSIYITHENLKKRIKK